MDIHKNARSCPASREVLFKRVSEQGWSVRAASAAAGISDRRGREWVGRARRNEPLLDRSSRPRSGRSIDATTRARIVALRRERRTMRQVAQIAGVSTSTVARVCRGEGLNRLRSLEPPPPPVRYERDTPGELLHLDTKRLGRFDGPGHRVTRGHSFGSKRQGFEFLYVATDDASRLAYAEILPDEYGQTASGFFIRAVRWFARLDVRVERVMTDNGSPFISTAFKSLCAASGIRHIRTRPYTPRTNGKVERLIQTLLREWAYRYAYPTSQHRARALPSFLRWYNRRRPHGSLKGRPPNSRVSHLCGDYN